MSSEGGGNVMGEGCKVWAIRGLWEWRVGGETMDGLMMHMISLIEDLLYFCCGLIDKCYQIKVL